MDDLMSQPNLNIAEFYNVAGDEPKNANLSSTASPMPGFPNRVTEQQEAALRQQALTLQTQPPKDSHVPPYLWSDPFTVMNTKFEDSQVVEDTDMLGDDFNWQDWSQSIRGLEMESTDPQKGW